MRVGAQQMVTEILPVENRRGRGRSRRKKRRGRHVGRTELHVEEDELRMPLRCDPKRFVRVGDEPKVLRGRPQAKQEFLEDPTGRTGILDDQDAGGRGIGGRIICLL
jgi:hypothetical protein